MGRRRQHDLDLPPLMYCKRRGQSVRYYYVKANIALRGDLRTALRKLHIGHREPGTFDDAVEAYRRNEVAAKAPKSSPTAINSSTGC